MRMIFTEFNEFYWFISLSKPMLTKLYLPKKQNKKKTKTGIVVAKVTCLFIILRSCRFYVINGYRVLN